MRERLADSIGEDNNVIEGDWRNDHHDTDSSYP